MQLAGEVGGNVAKAPLYVTAVWHVLGHEYLAPASSTRVRLLRTETSAQNREPRGKANVTAAVVCLFADGRPHIIGAPEVLGAVALINRAVVPRSRSYNSARPLCPFLTALAGIRICHVYVLGVRVSPRASGCGGRWRLDLTVHTPTGKTSCLARELQQEKLVVVDLRRGVGAGVSRGCSSGKYFSTDSHAAVQLFPQYRAVGGAREDHQ
jgi:hypothetical protein